MTGAIRERMHIKSRDQLCARVRHTWPCRLGRHLIEITTLEWSEDIYEARNCHPIGTSSNLDLNTPVIQKI